MKVADLMDDLETGDRSMEHLKKGAEPDEGLTFQRLRDAIGSLGSGSGQLGQGFSGGLTGSGMGLGFDHQQAMNQLMNQQIQNAQMFGQSMWVSSTKGW